jgi:hypothetical protein
LGGDVGIPMTIFCCALAAPGSAIAMTASAASVGLNFRM